MREIKFRAWDKATQGHWQPKPKGMIEFCLHNVPDYIGHTFNENGGVWERRFTVMQYTGLKDKNGKEIYEGDVVYIAGSGLVKVHFEEELAGFIFENDSEAFEYFDCYDDLEDVRGNIHENPELLGAN